MSAASPSAHDLVRVHWVVDGAVVKVTVERRDSFPVDTSHQLIGAATAPEWYVWDDGRLLLTPPTLNQFLPRVVRQQTAAQARERKEAYLDAWRRFRDRSYAAREAGVRPHFVDQWQDPRSREHDPSWTARYLSLKAQVTAKYGGR